MKILVDHGSSHNVGDTAMLEGVVERLRHLMPQAEVYVISRPRLRTQIWDGPQVFPQPLYGVRPFCPNLFQKLPYLWRLHDPWQKQVSALTLLYAGKIGSATKLRLSPPVGGAGVLGQFCEPFDSLHVVGGGNLTDTFLAELFRRCCLMFAFAEQGKPIILTGQQLGPFTSSLCKTAVARALRKASFVGVRGLPDSLEFCEEASLDPSRFELMGDDSLGLNPAPDREVQALLTKYGLKPNAFLALNVRVGSYTPEIAEHVQEVAALAGQLTYNLQMPALVVPVAYNPADSDVTSGRTLAEATRSGDVKVLEEVLTPALVKGVLGKAFGAIGASYHFCTFALSQGVPAICLHRGDYYSQKAREICGFWEDERLALPLKDLDVNAAVEHIVRVLQDKPTRDRLRLLAERARERWQSTFDRRVNEILGRCVAAESAVHG